MRTLRMLAGGGVQAGPFFLDRDGIWSIDTDADDVLDYVVDWTGWLAGDTISTSSWAAENVTVNSSANATTSATVWATAPADPYGALTNTIVTAGGRSKDLSIRLRRQSS